MATILNEKEYRAIMERIEELLPLSDDSTPADDKNLVELKYISLLAEEYEKEHSPIAKPSLVEVMQLRMEEQHLSKKTFAMRIGVSPSRVSEYMTGKCEPTLKVVRKICREFDISADVALGL